MTNSRLTAYKDAGLRLLEHLNEKLDSDYGYPNAPTWGYAFTYLAAVIESNRTNLNLARKALVNLSKQDVENPSFSWEFVIYAIQTSKKYKNFPSEFVEYCYREKGTRMFNWFLLRNQNKKLYGIFSIHDEIKLWFLSKLYRDPSGLILDEFKTRSLQYHAFCLFILADFLIEEPGKVWIREWFLKGVEFSVEQMLGDGTALYIGRGQEQIFGYGALLYVLEYCHKHVQKLDESLLDILSKKVLGFQRKNGSFPLVLRHREPEEQNVEFDKDSPYGWYGYNTLYDYQPFLAYCLMKTGYLR